MRIYIQIPYYNIHISPVFDELAKLPSIDLKVGLLKPGHLYRQGYHWDDEIDESIYIKLWQGKSVKSILAEADILGFHGFLGVLPNYKLIISSIVKGKNVLIFSEGIKPNKFSYLKSLLVKVINSKKVTFFEIGDSAYNDYRKLGATKWKNIPFAYSVNSIKNTNTYNSKQLKLTYVGQLIDRKRPFDLIKLMKSVELENIQLSVIGDGPLKETFLKEIKDCDLEDSIKFLGVKTQQEVINELLSSDCLILPSEYDGWGAVVNEAMECGAIVVCSDRCRVKSIVDERLVYPVGNIEALKNIIMNLMDLEFKSLLKKQSKERILNYRPEALAEVIKEAIN